jgi:hypothetical protein
MKILVLLSFVALSSFGGSALASEDLEIRYQLSGPKESFDVLAVPLSLQQWGATEVAETTVFGSQIHRPFLSIISELERKEKGGLLVRKEDQFSAKLINPRVSWIRMITSGIPIFRNVSQSYAQVVEIPKTSRRVQLDISSIEFGEIDGQVEYARYRFFMALINIPTLSEFDMRRDFRGSFKTYTEAFTRHDASFGMNEPPKPGLRTTEVKSHEGYIFSTCAIFREISPSEKSRIRDHCHEFSTSQSQEVFPINPGRKIHGKAHADFLYLIEREIKLRNSPTPQRSWIKVKVLPSQMLSLKSANWKNFP